MITMIEVKSVLTPEVQEVLDENGIRSCKAMQVALELDDINEVKKLIDTGIKIKGEQQVISSPFLVIRAYEEKISKLTEQLRAQLNVNSMLQSHNYELLQLIREKGWI